MTTTLLTNPILRQGIEVILTICFGIIVNLLLRSLIKLPEKWEKRQQRKYIVIIRNSITVLVSYFTLHAIFLILGWNITPLLASVGLIGIITALVANSVLGDILSGFFLLSQSNITVGDYIQSGDATGTITNLGIKNMTLKGNDGSMIIVPNGQIKTIINYSTGKSNIFIDIPIKIETSVDEQIKLFQQVLSELQKDTDLKISDKSQVIGIKELDLSAGTCIITTMITTTPQMKEKISQEFYRKIANKYKN